MSNEKLIEISLQKSYKGELNSGLNSVLFQKICNVTLESISENKRLKERLQISPQGDDKIDELEESLKYQKFKESKMNHKYLEDAGINLENTPYGWNPSDKRREEWNEQRKKYGFDERETWSVDTTFFYWLYERLKMYNEINIVNTKVHKFNIKGKELTQQQCIDRMMELCKVYFKIDDAETIIEENKIRVDVSEVFDILKECIWSLWW